MTAPYIASGDERMKKTRPGKRTDQHGRKFFSIDSRASGEPIGHGPKPMGWKAPWMPEQTYAIYDQDDHTKLTWDYERLLAERLAAHDAYDQAYNDFCVARNWDPNDETKRPLVQRVIGMKPEPFQLVVAAMQGNRYILGLTKDVDERVQKYLRMKPKYVRADKRQKQVADAMAEFADAPLDEAFEGRQDVEDEFDPEPRRTVRPRAKKDPLPPAA